MSADTFVPQAWISMQKTAMGVGLHSRDSDLVVNPVKTKQLTNIRAAGKDEAMLLTPPIRHTLESAVEFIGDDELVEITPSASAQAPAARARAQTRLPRRRLRKPLLPEEGR